MGFWHKAKLRIFLLGFVIFLSPLYPQNNTEVSQEDMFANMEFSLLTASPGGVLFNSWGHTLLLIQNKVFATDVAIDYGRFVLDPFFLLHFFKGEPTYYVGSDLLQNELERISVEGRFVYQQKLHLTVEQKKNIMQKITHDLLPENRKFVYHHFTQNCTTKIRDLLNKTLDNYLSNTFSKQTSNMSFRTQGVRKINISPWVKIPLNIFLGWQMDEKMSVYQSMFLPANFMKYVDTSRKELHAIYGYEVVEPIKIIAFPFGDTRAKEETVLQKNYTFVWLFIFFALAVLFLFYAFAVWRNKFKTFTTVLFILWAISSSLIGLMILYINSIAVQPELQANLNWLIFNPLNIVLLLFFYYFGKHEQKRRQKITIVLFIFFPLLTVLFRLFFWLPYPMFWQPTEYFSLYVLSFYTALFLRFNKI